MRVTVELTHWPLGDLNEILDNKKIQWRHNERDGASIHRRFHCLLKCWFSRILKETSKLRITGLCVGNSAVTGEFPAQRASNAEMFPFDDVIMNQANCSDWLLMYRL